jgi:hypothetical protein
MNVASRIVASRRVRVVVCLALIACVAILVATPQVDILPTLLRAKHLVSTWSAHGNALALLFSLRSSTVTAQVGSASLREEPFHPSLPTRLSRVCERLC